MTGSGFVEFLMVVLGLGSWGSLPLSMPPLPPDRVIERAAPDACLLHIALAGVARPADGTKNKAEALLAEPTVQRLLGEVTALMDGAIPRSASGESGMSAEAKLLLQTLLTRPAAFTIDSFAVAPAGPTAEASLVVNCGPGVAEVRRALDKLMDDLRVSQGARVREHEWKGDTWFRLEGMPDGIPDVAWGFKGNFCVIAVGKDALKNLLDRLSNKSRPSPAWKASLENRLPLHRRSLLVHIDIAKVMNLVTTPAPPAAVASFIKTSGLMDVAALQFIGGLTENEIASATVVDFNGKPQGVFRPAKGSVAVSDFKAIPADVTAAVVVKVDPSATLAVGIALAKAVDPQSAGGFKQALEQFRDLAGLDLDEHLLKPLGDTWTVFTLPAGKSLGQLQAVASVSLDDADLFTKTHEALLAVARRAMAQPGGPRFAFAERKVNATTIHSVSNAGSEILAAWCIHGDRLLVAATADLLEQMLNRPASSPSLADAPEIRTEVGEGAASVAYQDVNGTLALLEGVYSAMAPVAGGKVPKLPPSDVMARHMLPALSVVRRAAEDAIVAESRTTLPLGPLGGAGIGGGPATTGVLVGLMLPAIQAARDAARRSASVNNLKQMALAILNYESAKNRFPSSAICSKEGKPLLSWRVAILPFIEEVALYQEFRLDEPWDSEHNKKLIARMPAAFEVPGAGPIKPGMTRYIVPAGEGTVFPSPSEGLQLHAISDGMSKTILCVEAEAEKAVPWTKPDELSFNPRKPHDGVRNSRPQGFLAVFCDGHVQLIPGDTAADVLTALFSPSGGENVDLP